jgi:hypothetical protein
MEMVKEEDKSHSKIISPPQRTIFITYLKVLDLVLI